MSDDLDVYVTIPDDISRPVQFEVPESAYRFILVERAHVSGIDGTLGDYILLGPAGGDKSAWTFYVGQAGTGTVAQRLASHVAQKPWWVRALVVLPRPGHDGFSSASAGFLEGCLYRHLNECRFAVTLNGVTPGDDTPTEKEKARLRRGVIPPVMSILRMLGYDLTRTKASAPVRVADSDPRTPQPVTPITQTAPISARASAPLVTPTTVVASVGEQVRTRRSHWAKISHLVARGYLKDGETLLGRGAAEATVRSDGCLVVNGTVCRTPNRAWEVAVDARPGQTQNAWIWWAAERDGTLRTIAQIREDYEAQHPEDQERQW